MRSVFSGGVFIAWLCLLPVRARASSAFETVSVGLKGSASREASTRSLDWGTALSVGILTSDKAARHRLKYDLEYDYDDYSSKFEGGGSVQKSRVRASEFKYAKISVLQLFGCDLKEHLRFVPYVSGGVQYVDSRLDTDGDIVNDNYWAPTWGVGIEFALNKKTTLGIDYDANTMSGNRRISHLSLELKVAILGDNEE